ncbi:hypothetical protein J9978_07390 [Chromobacterium violaceum]|uniref:hypothetical protein n=1 Tax=Chromobacterium violaceum TaxID=536 RepID=UPI001B33BCAF|nr:hypothetical protein [Chromobacterium violaceum]MBP4049320.1 hypothetical protein [Chromobacterium violaceum]
MANLQEQSVWETGIYQLETSDPVLAGPDGVDNLQGKQLANRTAYLKDRVEELASGKQLAGNAVKLSAARNIAMSGDGSWNVAFDGSKDVSGQLTLRDSGVAPGSYGMVTVDAKGRVTAARQMSGDDVPAHDWNKVATGKPSTLAGYGIADGASKTDLQNAVNGLVSGAPANLNTLQELAAAVNNDPKYSATVDGKLAGKADKATTLVGYGISDAASKVDLKTVVDGVNSKKADKASTLDGYGITNGVAQADIGSLAVNYNASMLKMSSGSNALPISMGTGNPALFWKKFDVTFTPVQSNELPETRPSLVRELLQYIGSDVRYFSMGFNIMELTVKDPSIQMDFDFFIPYRHVKSGAGHSVIIYHKLLGKGDWTWLDNDVRGSWNQATRYVSSTAGGDYTHVDLKVVNPEVGSKLYLALPQIVIGKWDPKRRAPQFFNIYDIVQDMVPTATPSAYV